MVETVFSDDIRELAGLLGGYPAVYAVADVNVRESVTGPLAGLLERGGVSLRDVFHIRTSERLKTLKTVEHIHRWLIDAGADRDALLLAVGGGITTDLTGFAAATYKRGVKYVNVPTTLLAMVDASIGGKTGCNVGTYKNMCGAFLMPEFTFICPPLLKTLPAPVFTAGVAEMLKTFIIGDAGAYRETVEMNIAGQLRGVRKGIPDTLVSDITPLVRRAAEIKAGIVERDFRESGERRLLNLGHTFAHAIECLSAGRTSHGHAVASGMIMAAEMSEEKGIARPGLAAGLKRDFRRAGLPVTCRWSREDLTDVIRTDKKAAGGVVHYVLIEEIGRTAVI